MTEEKRLIWFNKLVKKHGHVCTYTLDNIKDTKQPMEIYCKLCKQVFHQSPYNNFMGVLGCNLYTHPGRTTNKKESLESLIAYSRQHNGLRYNFSESIYVDRYTRLKIFDTECGQYFTQTPNSHKRGYQCNLCMNNKKLGVYTERIIEKNKRILQEKPGLVYIINAFDDDEKFYKIGCTASLRLKDRFGSTKFPYNRDVLLTFKTNMYNAYYIEQFLLSQYAEYKYRPLKKFRGRTECFKSLPNIEHLLCIVANKNSELNQGVPPIHLHII